MPEEPTRSISDYLAVLRRRRTVFLGTAGVLAILIAAVAYLLPDVYRSYSVIEIDQLDVRNIEDEGLEIRYADRYVDIISRRVMSRDNIESMVRAQGLANEPKEVARTTKLVTKNAVINMISSTVLDPIRGREVDIQIGFSVGVDSEDPDFSHKAAIGLTELFMIENRRLSEEKTSGTVGFLATEAEKLSTNIAELEAKIADFKERNAGRLPELANFNMSLMERTENDLANANRDIDQRERELVILESQLSQLEATLADDVDRVTELQREYQQKSSIYSDTHPDLIRLRRELEALGASVDGRSASELEQALDDRRRQLTEARLRYSDEHPDVVKLERDITFLEDQLKSAANGGEVDYRSRVVRDPQYLEVRGRIQATQSEIRGLKAQATSLRNKLADYERRLIDTPQVEREYQLLQRELSNARTNYDSVKQRQRQAEFAEALEISGTGQRFTLVQRAFRPKEPAWPPRLVIAVLGVILGVAVGLFVVVCLEALDETVRDSKDLRALVGVPPIATVPHIDNTLDMRRKRLLLLASSGCGAGVLLLAGIVLLI